MDSEPKEISIPFHRPWLSFKLIILWLIAIIGLAGTAFMGMVALFDTPHSNIADWLGILIMAIFLALCGWPGLSWTLFLQRCWTKKLPAIVITKDGIIDNASSCAFGLLHWDDIQKIYPGRLTWRFFRKRSVIKPNMIVIVPKDMKQLASRYPTLKSLTIKSEVVLGRKWVAIPAKDLPVSPRELIRQINQFYITHVRDKE